MRPGKREMEVINLMAKGKTAAEVAQQLGTSVNTVKHQSWMAYQKLGVGSIVEAMNALGYVSIAEDASTGTYGPGGEWEFHL